MARLDGKVAVITGGGSGLGRAMAQRFAAEGAAVLVGDVNEAGAHETIAAITAAGGDAGRAVARRMDVTNEDDCAATVADAVSRWGRLDVMVANAGIGAPAPIAMLDLDDWERVLRVNLTGVFLCAKHAFRAMQAAQSGAILATASVAALRGTPGLGAYGPSKAAVVQLVKTLALEGARYNIRANALCPVWTDTPMVEAFVAGMRVSPDVGRSRLVDQIPLGRLGQPEDVAAAALYLASDEAAFISGHAFPIDGASLA
jgi:NAD(P)-dependent dehydrogenase (short-subunit alcohol dehydrogenase family)